MTFCFADHAYDAFSANDFAFWAAWFDGWFNFHFQYYFVEFHGARRFCFESGK